MPDSPQYHIVFSERSKDQILDLYNYYESISIGLAEEFMESLGQCLQDLQTSPTKWQFARSREEMVRRAIIRKPNVVILYSIESEKVLIASLHDSRSNWK